MDSFTKEQRLIYGVLEWIGGSDHYLSLGLVALKESSWPEGQFCSYQMTVFVTVSVL